MTQSFIRLKKKQREKTKREKAVVSPHISAYCVTCLPQMEICWFVPVLFH